MIEIAVSVWNPPGQSLYSALLRYQIASLVIHRSKCDVSYNVYYAGETHNPETHRILWDADSRGYLMNERSIHFRPIAMAPQFLFRRAISRDRACRDMHRDSACLWMTDVDYFCRPGFLDTLHQLAKDDAFELGFPKEYWINTTHKDGDDLISGVADLHELWLPNDDAFSKRKARVAIGGLQCIHKSIAHHGYLRGTKWVEPVDPSLGFRSCKCDKAYRRWHGEGGVRNGEECIFIPLDIPGLRRIRHSVDGRDYSSTGEKIGKTSW